jgi:2-methylcitrate dehydratase PrpD
VLDWICATVVGAREAPARAVQAVLAADGCVGASSVIGSELRTAAAQAALANGVAAHAVELDDMTSWMRGHPGASVCSATIALAESRGSAGTDALIAIVAGYEIACRIGLALGPGHGAAGWHATGTVGTFAAAAACARLISLDADATARALGLAAVQAAGLNAGIGTMAKPLHAGRAAANGLTAALLAEQGFTGPADAIEDFADTHTTSFDPARPDAVIGRRRGISSVTFKRYACCGLLNPSVAALAALRAEHAIEPGAVLRLSLAVPEPTLAICGISEPTTALEGKFSFRFAAAVAMAGRERDADAFTDASVADPALIALRDRVDVFAHGRADTQVDVELALADGRRLATSASPAEPATDEELPEQWRTLGDRLRLLAGPVIGPAACERVVAAVRDLDGPAPVSELLAAVRR